MVGKSQTGLFLTFKRLLDNTEWQSKILAAKNYFYFEFGLRLGLAENTF